LSGILKPEHRAPRQSLPSNTNSGLKVLEENYDSVAVHVDEEHVRFGPEVQRGGPQSNNTRTADTRPTTSKHGEVSESRHPPMGLASLQNKRTYYHRTESEEEEDENIRPTSRPPSFDKFVQDLFKGKGILY
jgi:hypothetical protein